MRTEQIRLAKAANISPEELDGVNLIWYAIGRIEGMQNRINELESAIKNLHKVKGRYHTQEATTILEELRKDNKCASCTNRGKADGLTQETYCDSCIYAEPWRKDNYNAMKGGECDRCQN